jgi:hypothetical protein
MNVQGCKKSRDVLYRVVSYGDERYGEITYRTFHSNTRAVDSDIAGRFSSRFVHSIAEFEAMFRIHDLAVIAKPVFVWPL